MKLLHYGPYTQEECVAYKGVIYSNTVSSMKVLVQAMHVLGILTHSTEASHAAMLLDEAPDEIESQNLDPNLAQGIATLWADRGVREAFSHYKEFQLSDSAPYYFDAIDRIGLPGYVPSDQDVLRSRVKTTGIIEETFEMDDGIVYRMFDVGGQRSERRKWIHCFEAVTGLLFLVALSEYDQALYEDQHINRMQEALTLFNSICNSRWFAHSSIILFMNKIDLFRAKLRTSPLQNYFADYAPLPEADQDFDKEVHHAANFLTDKFLALSQDQQRVIYSHLTCATDTSQFKIVFQAVRDHITRSNLREVGLL